MVVEQASEDFKTRNENARGGGMRGIMAMGQGNQSIKDKVMQQVSGDLDAKQKELDLLGAKDEIRIEENKIRVSEAELAGYGKLLDVGMDTERQGMGNMMSSLGGMAGGMTGGAGGAGGAAGAGAIDGAGETSVWNQTSTLNSRV